jgi:hypothetical protein
MDRYYSARKATYDEINHRLLPRETGKLWLLPER